VPKNEPGLAVDFVTNLETSSKPIGNSDREALQRGNDESAEVEENICDPMVSEYALLNSFGVLCKNIKIIKLN
jgi:hypothetical protein